MAPFSNYFSFLFFTALLLSLQINARDSQFFSKVTHDNNNNNSNNNFKETELPNKEEPVNRPEQEPVFTPETESSYGLYGHESGLFPPSTTTTTTTTTNDAPYTANPSAYEPESEQEMSKYTNKDSYNTNTRLTESSYSSNKGKNNNNYYYNKDSYEGNQNEIGNTRLIGHSYSSNNNNYYDKKDAYGKNQNEFGNTRLTESSYTNNDNNNANYYYNKDTYEGNQNEIADAKYTEGEHNSEKNQKNQNNNNENYHYVSAASYRNNGERQGMSDTRFVENGRYYYHINSQKYNPTLYGDSSRGVDSKNWYNYRGYFGNNNANSYQNDNNNMERYQNSEEFEDDEEP